MKKYWSARILNSTPYVYGEQPQDRKYIKLNTNENPYSPSPKVVEAIKNFDFDRLKLYSDPNCTELKDAISDYYKVGTKEIFIGNGSDEVLAFAFLAFFNPDDTILFPEISYSFYDVYADFFGVGFERTKLNGDFSLSKEDFMKENDGIIIANPNAPTSVYFEKSDIIDILEKNREKVVIVDEAYIDFGGESCIDLTEKYDNLLVVQTFSKSRSLAGMRVGFAIGNENLINALEAVKNSINSYTLDMLATRAATEAMKDVEYFEMTRNKIITTREKTAKILEENGFNVLPSKSNFLFASHNSIFAYDIFQKLREKGILVRYFSKPKIDNYLRISIGSEEEMELFCKEIKEIVKK